MFSEDNLSETLNHNKLNDSKFFGQSGLGKQSIKLLWKKLRIITAILGLKVLYHYCILAAVRKLDFCICEIKDTDQLVGNPEADQRLCFHYTDSTIPFLT